MTVPPFPYEDVRAIIVQELGAPPEDLFATFSAGAAGRGFDGASASCHTSHGRGGGGQGTAPEHSAKVNADLRVMRKLAVVLEKRLQFARQLNLSGIVERVCDWRAQGAEFQE